MMYQDNQGADHGHEIDAQVVKAAVLEAIQSWSEASEQK